MNHQRKSAVGEFFHTNYNRLVSYVRGMIDDSAHRSSEDIVQDVMLSILDRPDIVAPISDMSAYVFRALRNRIIDFYRNPAKETVSMDSEDENGLSLFDVLPDEKYDPEGSYRQRALRRLIFRLIRELPSAQMEVIIETEFNERTFRELSGLWKVPVGTLLARKHRGVRAIRKKLERMQEVKNE
ncbi:MAG: sigma-70 family RNA polymerase sigma factor [Candidatus Aegiribacteria sp.]|nr:sigma-70 family RNA polymerase sigma factor [Candidatus Aegiribacteria sp.]